MRPDGDRRGVASNRRLLEEQRRAQRGEGGYCLRPYDAYDGRR